MIAPHTPPQNASEITAGTPKGGTPVINQGVWSVWCRAWKSHSTA